MPDDAAETPAARRRALADRAAPRARRARRAVDPTTTSPRRPRRRADRPTASAATSGRHPPTPPARDAGPCEPHAPPIRTSRYSSTSPPSPVDQSNDGVVRLRATTPSRICSTASITPASTSNVPWTPVELSASSASPVDHFGVRRRRRTFGVTPRRLRAATRRCGRRERLHTAPHFFSARRPVTAGATGSQPKAPTGNTPVQRRERKRPFYRQSFCCSRLGSPARLFLVEKPAKTQNGPRSPCRRVPVNR